MKQKRKTKTIEQRFWKFVKKTNGCWLWTGSKEVRGYGIFMMPSGSKPKTSKAHRISYELHYGAFDKSLNVCHHCDNLPCVRPDHLFLGTQKDNMADCKNKGRNHIHRRKEPFFIISPNGEKIIGWSIKEFCEKYELNRGHFSNMLAGREKSCRGYKKFI